jgi:hypothetical protein
VRNGDDAAVSKEDFFHDLRRAWRHLHGSPSAVTESPSLDARILTRPLSKVDLWLTPKVMDDFRTSDFEDLDVELQKELKAAVREFRSFARTVARNAPVSNEQYIDGLKRFEHVAQLVRRIILDDWASSFESLVTDVEGWSRSREWPFRRETKEIAESLLDRYSLPAIFTVAGVTRILLEPVARFVPSAFGVAELSAVPSYASITIRRTVEGWDLRLPVGNGSVGETYQGWSLSAFDEAVGWLVKHA